MRGILNRWLWTAKPGSWQDRVVYYCIYCIVVYHKTKWTLFRYLPKRLKTRLLFGKDACKAA
jgi:hypothetical protein